MRQVLSGSIYTVDVKIRQLPRSNATVDNFSTFDGFTDSYSWRQWEDISYLVVPGGRKGNCIDVVVYLQMVYEEPDHVLRCLAQKVLEGEFFPNVSGVKIARIGKPKLFLDAHSTEDSGEDDTEYRSERIFDMITHL